MLRKELRIQLTEEIFQQFQIEGERYYGKKISAKVLRSDAQKSKFAVLVPKGLDKRATKRNKLRRLAFEVIGKFYIKIKRGRLVLFQVHDLSLEDKDVELLLNKVGLLSNE